MDEEAGQGNGGADDADDDAGIPEGGSLAEQGHGTQDQGQLDGQLAEVEIIALVMSVLAVVVAVSLAVAR